MNPDFASIFTASTSSSTGASPTSSTTHAMGVSAMSELQWLIMMIEAGLIPATPAVLAEVKALVGEAVASGSMTAAQGKSTVTAVKNDCRAWLAEQEREHHASSSTHTRA